MSDGTVSLDGVRVLRQMDDDTLLCVIDGVVRFIPTGHIHAQTAKPGEVGTLVIPRWLATSLGLG